MIYGVQRNCWNSCIFRGHRKPVLYVQRTFILRFFLSNDDSDFRELGSRFLPATMSTANSSVKDPFQITLPTASLPVDSKTITPSACNHVSQPLQSSTQLPSTHPTTSPSPYPTTPNPTNAPLNSSVNAASLPN